MGHLILKLRNTDIVRGVSTQWGEESKQAQKLQTELMQENGGEFQLSPKSYVVCARPLRKVQRYGLCRCLYKSQTFKKVVVK